MANYAINVRKDTHVRDDIWNIVSENSKMCLQRKCKVSEHISQHVSFPFQTGGPDIKVHHKLR